MPPKQEKTSKRVRRKVKGALKKVSSRPKKKGVDMSDLVGTIQLSLDPVEYQRKIRDEW
jgi:hypothetical protein